MAANVEDTLREAILAAGVGIEQIGVADGIDVSIDDDGTITLELGEEGEEQFDDEDEALARIDEYAEEYGGDGSRPGAVIELCERLDKLVAKRAKDQRARALGNDLFDKVLSTAEKLGMEHVPKVYLDDDHIEADADEDVGFFNDGNDVLWHLYVEDGRIRYKLFEAPD